MVGQPNHKRRPDGTRYTSVYSYRCNNHDCNYKRLPNEKKINGAVEEILTALVSNPRFAQKMKDRVDQKVDYSELDATIERLSQNVKQAIQRKDRLIAQIDNLSIIDANYDRKSVDLEKRLDDAYDKIADADNLLKEAMERREKVRQEQINGEIVYKNLLVFDKVISKCSDIEKKKLYELLIKEIQIYETSQEDGRQIKSIIFNFPVMYGKDEVDYMCLSEKQIDETVCLLSRITPDAYITVDLDMSELDLTSAEAKATYNKIRDFVKNKYGFHVTNLNIAQVKQKYGIIERVNYNVGEGKSRVPNTPQEKLEAIEDALRFYKMI